MHLKSIMITPSFIAVGVTPTPRPGTSGALCAVAGVVVHGDDLDTPLPHATTKIANTTLNPAPRRTRMREHYASATRSTRSSDQWSTVPSGITSTRSGSSSVTNSVSWLTNTIEPFHVRSAAPIAARDG